MHCWPEKLSDEDLEVVGMLGLFCFRGRSQNRSTLRLQRNATESFEQISHAVVKFHKMGVKQVLVKLGSKGSALFVEGQVQKGVLEICGCGSFSLCSSERSHS
ncbi:uncharacterized protein Pyn_30074 [Prunus yedoensis var. nudiflora]|uniref:Uncharacterized protein n=1 Tax=Prunus yedoensis var. nudiflora TaxID=2094558 RepID=A0A314ZKL8_PRUYE|nr:uncharacterized protein Pyn_30074 [Prunus yedoensis var. nudiflora]